MNITVPINRKRFPIVVIVGLLLTIVFFILFISTKTKNIAFEGILSKISNIVIVFIPALFTLIAFSDYMKTLFDKNAMLKISENGLYDNISLFSCGLIPWETISDVKVENAFKADFLIIKLTNPKEVISRQNILKQIILKKYYKKWETPFIISEKRIGYNLQELKNIILKNKK